MRQVTIICILFFSAMVLIGFQEDELDVRIQDGIRVKIEILKKEKRADCRLLAIQNAEQYIDSLVAVEVTDRRLQNSGIPVRPIRPESDARDSIEAEDMKLVPILPQKKD